MLPDCDMVVSAWTDLARLLCSEGVTPHTCGNSLRYEGEDRAGRKVGHEESVCGI